MTSRVLKHTDPDIICFLHKPFDSLAIKSSVTLFSGVSPSIIQLFGQVNAPGDGSDFKTGPAWSWGSDKMTSRGPLPPEFFYDSMREVVTTATVKIVTLKMI